MTHEVLTFCRIKLNVIYRLNPEKNRLLQLSPQCQNGFVALCTCDQEHELRPSHCDDNLDSTFSQDVIWHRISKSYNNAIFVWPHCPE